MSDREFEIYLKLLAKMLRLSESQRRAIESELRDHLEQRLEELVEQGLTRDAAVEAALEEFGDAAGLAQHFTHIATLKRRRLIMRYSFASLCALALAATIILSILPERRDMPLQPLAVAEETPAQSPAATSKSSTLTESKKIEAKLATKMEFVFTDEPLEDVVQRIHDETGVAIFVNWTVLQNSAGIDRSTPVTLNVAELPASRGLKLLLEQFGELTPLNYLIHEGVVMISTQEALNRYVDTRGYDIRDLVLYESGLVARSQLLELVKSAKAIEVTLQNGKLETPALSAKLGADLARLIDEMERLATARLPDQSTVGNRVEAISELITETIDPDNWRDAGGIVGTLYEMDGILIITTTDHVHREIEALLAKLREYPRPQTSGIVGQAAPTGSAPPQSR